MALQSSPEILVIGGEIAAGKTSLATRLSEADCTLVRVRDALQSILGGVGWDRRRLQMEGADLDNRTGGRWLLDYLADVTANGGRWVVDAGRTRRQVEPILEHLVGSRLVFLRAHESIRRARYLRGQAEDPVKRSVSFDEAMAHPTEREALTLAAMAHLVIDTDDLERAAVLRAVRDWMGW